MHGQAYSRSRLCGSCAIGISERGPAINQMLHQIQNEASIKEVCVLVVGFFMSMSIIDLYSTESRSISTALCVLSGSDEIDSSSVIV